ncbi:TROVE domain-containing protein [Dactylosporangium sp. CA-139066]|uniref:TROVE domain-containing protein n=1 Tax=Dactylosporangium sp. CA-139066 TaxID=3239930 RepID=UPI003D8F04C0
MSKFNVRDTRAASGTGPIVSEQRPTGVTHEGGAGYARDVRSGLFLLAVANMVGEATFYESAGGRDSRYVQLVHEAAVTDPAWTAQFLGWLRGAGNMRTASIVGAAEYVRSRLTLGGGDQALPAEARNRAVVASVLQRADEPGELLAYWTSRYGRKIPMPVKNGIGDAVQRLYTERSLLKYDTASRGWRFGDVIDMTHPKPSAPWQGDLFKVALDWRHGRDDVKLPGSLSTLVANLQLRLDAAADPVVLLDAGRLAEAGWTWENALSLAGSKLDKAKLWEALIPAMGYMALLRNLRNFDEAGVSDTVADQVAARLSDPEQVAKSRQLPMRFLSAYRAAPSLRWSYPLEQALGHCLGNIPRLGGRTLVLVDTSSSMNEAFSKDGTLMRWDAAVVFAVALAQRCAAADVVSFSSMQQYWGDPAGAKTKPFDMRGGESLLRAIDRWRSGGWFLGGGTDTAGALRKHYAGHDRVVIVTDEQAGVDGSEVSQSMPQDRPLYTWNLAGYERGHAPSGRNRWTFGGLTDAGFSMIPLIESGREGAWPWQAAVS